MPTITAPPNPKFDALMEEALTRHATAFQRLEKTSKKLHQRFVSDLRKGSHDDAGLAQIAGLTATIWRFHAEGFKYISPATLEKAATILDGIAEEYPPERRFKVHFEFNLDSQGNEQEARYGRAVLRFLARAFQAPFADEYGTLRDDIDRAAFDRLRETMSRPLPVDFFIEIGLLTTMHGVAMRLYDEYRGVDPTPAIEKMLRPYGGNSIREGTEKIEKALAYLLSKPTPELETPSSRM